jgi:perosamine synthetase
MWIALSTATEHDVKTIPLSEPHIAGNAWTYVRECLDSGWVSSAGSFVDRFEREAADRVGVKHAVAVTSGTAALHVALLVAGVRRDDEVLVSDLTFIAPANAVRYVDAWPVFVDAEPDHWQMDVSLAASFLREQCRQEGGELRNRTTGRRVSAVMPVHILGHPVDMDPLRQVAAEFGLTVIEDATESFGGSYKNAAIGRLGHVACLSFNGNKTFTTGGGGMVLTDNDAWAERARYLTTQAKDDPIEYEHHTVGYNYRLTNIQAALGCAQLEQATDFLGAKRRIAARYAEAFGGVPGITMMREASWGSSAFWLSTVVVDAPVFGMSSRELMTELSRAGIQTRPLWQPLHRSAAHAGATALGGEVADRLNRDCLNLPSSVGLSPVDQERVIAAIQALHRNALVSGVK